MAQSSASSASTARPCPRSTRRPPIIAPAGHRGPTFIVFDNFRTILDYNNSLSYALAVAHLADVITGQAGIRGAMAARGPPLSAHRQAGPAEPAGGRGLDPGDNDGVIGQGQVAIRQFQRQIGEVPDGFPTLALLTRLRAMTSS